VKTSTDDPPMPAGPVERDALELPVMIIMAPTVPALSEQ
jgi:hypothetical protein